MKLSAEGFLYKNRTLKYLVPSFNMFFGEIFSAKLNAAHKLAFGIHDCYLDGSEYHGQKLVYILFDKLYREAPFMDFLRWIQYQNFYVTDYPFDDMEIGRQHMVVVRIPLKFENIYEKFLEGKYSQMYVKEELNMFPARYAQELEVFRRTGKARTAFAQMVNERYNTTITPADLLGQGAEYDFPPDKKEEYFNYQGE